MLFSSYSFKKMRKNQNAFSSELVRVINPPAMKFMP